MIKWIKYPKPILWYLIKHPKLSATHDRIEERKLSITMMNIPVIII